MGRSPTCCSTGNHLKKGPWSVEEDRLLMDYIEKNGHGCWRVLAKNSGLNRCGKSCRLRWINYLNPEIKRGKFSEEEERIIINLHSTLGNNGTDGVYQGIIDIECNVNYRWSKIAGHLPGRTDNEVKNFWNSHVKKKLLNPSTQQISHLHNLLNLSDSISLNNPWNNIAAIRPLINHLATTQFLQNIMQTMNKFRVPSIEEINLTQNSYRHPSINNPSQGFIRYLNPNIFSGGNVYDIANPLASSEVGGIGQPILSLNPINSEIFCSNRLSFNTADVLSGNASLSQTQSENWPHSTLDHSSIATRFDHNMQPTDDQIAFCSNPELDMFEEWEKLVDDETNNSLWGDIIE